MKTFDATINTSLLVLAIVACAHAAIVIHQIAVVIK